MSIKQFLKIGLLLNVVVFTMSCSNDDNSTPDPTDEKTYALGLGVTSNGTTTNYVAQANDLMTGKISLVGNGLPLIGYRDFTLGNQTLFAVGGFDAADVNGITQDVKGILSIGATVTFDRAVDDMQQVDDTQMLALEYPTKAEGDQARFYFINIANKAISLQPSSPLAPLVVGGENPSPTGMAVNGNKLFVSFLPFGADFSTKHTDSNYVAVYTYPDIKFEKVITDTRTGPSGAWGTRNGLVKTENGDIYAMSSSNISNGYSQSTKPGGFLRIKNGESTFDPTYFFNTDKLGGKISHVKYLGNGWVFAAISTLTNQTSTDAWGDKSLKLAIVDMVNQTITDVKLAGGTVNDLIHNGTGARSFPVLVDQGKVYYPITGSDGATHIYQIDVVTATATKGAEVQATFVGGLFKMK